MSASLPTPPRSSVDKENWDPSSTPAPSSSPRKSIEWAPTKEVFSYAPVSGRAVTVPRPSRSPRKSILKPARPSASYEQDKKRDDTPLPENPLENAEFLVYPVSVIVKVESTLRELTEAYSVLTARIRQAVPPNFFTPTRDTRHELFNPLRQEADALSSAIVRDLGRVFVDPFLPPNSPPATPTKTEKTGLHTPQDSPVPKKGGMNEEQVKYARDLSTVSNATIKFITMTFQVPAIYNVFSEKHLRAILTALLAIPLAESIRSPTARKICGLAISALQSQRLPDRILSSAAPRIAFALKRAIEGELGREGKKGATAEAFRAVHDLSTYRPGIFIPIFKVYLTTILDALLTPSGPLRVLAAHALGGFVLGIAHAKGDFEELLCEISPVVSEYFLRKEPQAGSQTTILRTLRTALRTPDPTHHAQGPFWATSVLASLIVLLGPALLKDKQVLVAFRGTIDIGLKAKKRLVRAIVSTLWGPLIWVWQKWRTSMVDEVDADEEDDDISERERVKTCFSTMIRMTTHLPIGVSFIGALLGGSHDDCREEDLFMALHEMRGAARQGGESTQRALDLMDRLVNSREDADFYDRWEDNFLRKLVPKSLFSVSPGLLTTEITVATLSPAIEGIVCAQPCHADVRPLADEEKCAPGVWTCITEAWMSSIEQLEMSENDTVPDAIIDIWTGLVRMGLMRTKDDPNLLANYAGECTEILISIFTSNAVDLRERPANSSPMSILGEEDHTTTTEDTTSAANMHLKLVLVRSLWTHMINVLPSVSLPGAWKLMIRYLTKHQDALVPSSEMESEAEAEALSEWSQFCGHVAALASADITTLIWSHDWEWNNTARARAWRGYARGWAEDSGGSWREAASILVLPFRVNSPWDMSDADLSAWSGLLAHTVEMAAKDGHDAPAVLEFAASQIEDKNIVSLSSALVVADHLVGTLEKHIENCSELPNSLIYLVHDILLTSYPSRSGNKTEALWLLRSLQATISNCPVNLVIELLEKLHDGLCTWIADECSLFSPEEYSSDIISLFQTVLCAIEPLPPSVQVLQSFSTLFASALLTDSQTGELSNDRAEALAAFTDFWNNNCQSLEPPKSGWSDGILHALALAFPTANHSGSIEMDLPDDVPSSIPELISFDSDEEDELDVLPRTSTPLRRSAGQAPSSVPIPADSTGQATTIPQVKTPKKTAKYTDLQGLPRLPGLFGNLSSSPRDECRRGRLWDRSGSRTVSDSSAVSDGAEKENVIPQGQEVAAGIVYPGLKRGALADADSSPLRSKRMRTETSGSDDSVDARAVEEILHVVKRSPFGPANVNACALETPTKQCRTAAVSNLSADVNGASKSSASKRQKSWTSVIVIDDGDDDDDEYIPSSSDMESEGENDPSSSSSPVGPFTPRAARRAEYAIAITQDPASDDIITSSSPTRKIRRMARIERMGPSAKAADTKMNDTGTLPPQYLKWSKKSRCVT